MVTYTPHPITEEYLSAVDYNMTTRAYEEMTISKVMQSEERATDQFGQSLEEGIRVIDNFEKFLAAGKNINFKNKSK